MAWNGAIARVDVQVDGGPWMPAAIAEGGSASAHSWKFWMLDWGTPSPDEHALTSRAIDTAGNIQPVMTDPVIATKRTYWESNGQITRRVKIV